MKFIILACFIAVASAGIINQASPLTYSAGIPSPVSYSNLYNSPILRSAAPYYPSVSPLTYNAIPSYGNNAIPSYGSYAASPLAYNGYGNGYGFSPLAYNTPAVQQFQLASPILRNPYIRSYPYSLY